MSERTHTFNWVLDTGKFLTEEEAKKLLGTARNLRKAMFPQL
ncbi:MAG: hypothetical protein P8016_07260 [Sedimentisphaerales bacterium]